jgi:UDP-N-acetylmuramoyl-L-alanyl-D-glutamate--2,6-diaminopimelate ligase
MNAYNGLAAVATAVALEVPFQAIEQGVAALEGVPGRFEVVSTSSDDVWVVVDFAHTEDALRALLGAVRELGHGRLITVFGCGGDRDRDKRPTMGATAARFSDLVILTADNPRSEDPAQIIAEISRGIVSTNASSERLVHIAIPDRAAAIERAIAQAEPGDAVVIAGKGHEVEQQMGGKRFPFDDRSTARAALKRRRRGVRKSQRP